MLARALQREPTLQDAIAAALRCRAAVAVRTRLEEHLHSWRPDRAAHPTACSAHEDARKVRVSPRLLVRLDARGTISRAQTRSTALSSLQDPGLSRGLVRVPATRAPRAIELAVGRG